MEKIKSEFINYIKWDKELSSNTIESYKRDLNKFIKYLDENNINIALEEISQTNIISYMFYLEIQGKAPSTISRNLASIRSFYQYLLNEGLIKKDPTLNLKSPKNKKRSPGILTSNEINMLLDQPDTTNLKGVRDKAMLELLYAAGLKVSELLSLDLEDIDLNLGIVISSKNLSNERVIPIGKTAIKSIKLYLDEYRNKFVKEAKDNSIFLNYQGKKLTRQGFWKIIKYYKEKACIEKKITPRTLRHSFAVHLIDNGADLKSVQAMLGHADISSTQIYMQEDKKRLNEVYNNAHPRA
ncbi:MAG: site-specific tyrosine recombinase XerD [Senegalia sp. (in: firmicutes)]|uniref:site-specific tyrosine recombinase XerD n=1 Tax=Senegalia sp. (in: firmicutes) TaxID=1924098 RepID=UPI003F9B9522